MVSKTKKYLSALVAAIIVLMISVTCFAAPVEIASFGGAWVYSEDGSVTVEGAEPEKYIEFTKDNKLVIGDDKFDVSADDKEFMFIKMDSEGIPEETVWEYELNGKTLTLYTADGSLVYMKEAPVITVIRKANKVVHDFVWGWPALILLAFVGILMTVLTKFFQVSHIGHWLKNTIGAIFKDKHVTKHTNDKSISQFQSLCTALAATVGTGNIAGIASAIAAGGPGAVLWMWVIAFFGMMTNYSENVLGILFRKKNDKGEWSGGAMYYLRDGLGAKKGCKKIGMILAVLFSCFCLLASFGIGNMTQVNTIASNMESAFNIKPYITGIIVMILVALVVVGGLKRIAAVTEKIVPIMVVLYLLGTVTICALHINMIGAVLKSIFKSAFGLRAVGGAVVGSGVKLAVQMGMKRGVFSNEAGLGSSVMVHSNSNVKEPIRQGMWGIFEVFADTIVVCTLTAFALLSSGLVNLETGKIADAVSKIPTGQLVGQAFGNTFGQAGVIFIAVALLLFAFSTVLGWSHYGTKACEYLFGTKSTMPYRLIFVVAVFGGAVMGENLAWDLSDTFNGLMMLPNLIGVLVLSPLVFKCTKNYIDRHMRHKNVEPMLSMDPEIQKEHSEAVKKGAE